MPNKTKTLIYSIKLGHRFRRCRPGLLLLTTKPLTSTMWIATLCRMERRVLPSRSRNDIDRRAKREVAEKANTSISIRRTKILFRTYGSYSQFKELAG